MMKPQEVIDAFDFLDDWDERFELVTELGRGLAPMPEGDKTDANQVPGCTTRTWLSGHLRPAEPPVIEYLADAEGPLVRGLVALLLAPFQGRTPAEVLALDPNPFIGRLGLEDALSVQRRAGMYAFIDRVKLIARAHLHPASGQ